MKRKRRKGESTVKKVKIIASIISTCIFFGMIIWDIVGLVEKGGISTADIYSRIGWYPLLLILAILLYLFIFCLLGGEEEMRKEQNRKIKAKMKEMLSETEFKEVSLQNANSERPMEMLMDILEDEGCKFYARIDGNEIIIKCTDKSGKTVYEDAISNGFYFKKFFKVL